MADAALIWVRATSRGQLSNLNWVDENSPPFQVEKSKFSKRWMKALTDEEIAALKGGGKKTAAKG